MSDFWELRKPFELALLSKQFPHRSVEDLVELRERWISDGDGYFQRSSVSGQYITEWVEYAWWGWRTAYGVASNN